MIQIGGYRTVKPTMAEIGLLQGRWREHSRYQGCVGHWLLNESAGLNVFDLSGMGNNGSLVNSPTWGTSTRGSSLSFDGTSQYGNLGAALNLRMTGALTYAVWFRTTSGSLADRIAIARRASDSAAQWVANLEFTSGAALSLWVSSGSAVQSSGNSATGLNNGIWHLGVGTYTPSVSLKVYVDGRLANTNTTSIYASLNNITVAASIGARIGPSLYFPGEIGEARMYNRALSDVEIQSLYYEPFLEFTRANEIVSRSYFFIAPSGGASANVSRYYYTMNN
jgi:hypothetical protein